MNTKSQGSFAIKHKDGTYYEKWTGIGPMFGATEEKAQRFPGRYEAAREFVRHYSFGECDVVELDCKCSACGVVIPAGDEAITSPGGTSVACRECFETTPLDELWKNDPRESRGPMPGAN